MAGGWKNTSGFAKLKWKAAEKGFQKELSGLSWRAEKEAIARFMEASESFVKRLPDHEEAYMPFVTGNLHDSIASVVSNKGSVVRAVYTNPVAKTTSSVTGKEIFAPTKGMGRKKIIGSLAASTMVRNMNGKFPGKIAITMLIGVPYDETPNVTGPHIGYKDMLVNLYAQCFQKAFRFHAYKSVLEAKGNLEQYVLLAYDQNDPDQVPIRKTSYTPSKRRGRPKGSGGYMGSAGGGMRMLR